MILPDGSDFPRDYMPKRELTPGGAAVYIVKGGPKKAYQIHPITNHPCHRYEDDPVVLAHEVLTQTLDMSSRQHRELYLSWLSLALPMDAWDKITSVASKIMDAIQEQNRMEDLEKVMIRLDDAERRMGEIEMDLSDDARAQGDAVARSGESVMTAEIER